MAIDIYELALRFKSEGFTAVSKDLDTLDKKGKGIAKAFSALKATLIVGAVGGFVRKIALESIEAQKQTAQLNAVLKSTGGIAGVTAPEIEKIAAALQQTTTFGDDAVKSAASLLLTFTNIRGEVFKNTLPAVLDMAQAMGTDLNSAVIQVGKALNDPIKGVTALRKVGVAFSESQQAVIKNLVETNRLAEAQGLILKELNTEFGGSAEAARNTLGGALAGLGNAWGDLFEVTAESSQGIIGAINSLAENLPNIRSKFDAFFEGLKNGFTGLKIGYLQDAADIQEAFSFFARASAFVTFGEQQKKALRASADNADEFVERTRKQIAELRRLAGGGMFGDVSSGFSTTGTKPKPSPPPFGGGGTGKDKGPKIPNIDLSSTNQAALEGLADKLGSSFKDPFAAVFDMSDFGGKTTEQLKKWFEEQADAVEEGKKKVEDALIEHTQMIQDRADWMADTIGNAIQNGIIAAFQGEGVSGAIAAFGKTILAAIGDMMVQKGTAMIAEGLIMSGLVPFLSNPFTAGPALLAAGAALVALGSTLGAIVSGGGRGGGGSSHGFRQDRVGTEEITRLQFVNRPSYAGNVTPMQQNHFTFIGANDPKVQRQFEVIMDKQNRRKG